MTVITKVLAAASGALMVCCSAGGPDAADAPPHATLAGGAAQADAPLPPPPPSPLPSNLNLPGSSGSTTNPGVAPPGGAARVLWATAGTKLLKLTSTASTAVDVRDVVGLAPGEQLVGLDFRKNGTLYAIGSSMRLFSLAPQTAKATAVSFAPFAAPLDGTAFGFGFDPISDLARVTSATAENIRVEADTGTVSNVDGSVHFAPDDANVAVAPRATGVAYAANGDGYAIDAKSGCLARIVDSYSGELTTVGALGVSAVDVAGFDISGSDAFAALRVGAVTSLFAVDLASGKVVSMGKLGDGGPVTGLAIQP